MGCDITSNRTHIYHSTSDHYSSNQITTVQIRSLQFKSDHYSSNQIKSDNITTHHNTSHHITSTLYGMIHQHHIAIYIACYTKWCVMAYYRAWDGHGIITCKPVSVLTAFPSSKTKHPVSNVDRRTVTSFCIATRCARVNHNILKSLLYGESTRS